MSRVPIESQYVRELAHTGLKTLQSVTDLLELYDINKTGGIHDRELRKIFSQSIHSLAQAVQDLRLLVICEDISPNAQAPLNWKSLVENNLSGRNSATVSLAVDEADYNGTGYTELAKWAVSNLAWFARKFWKNQVKVNLSVLDKEHSPWICLKWDFGNSLSVNSEFASFPPYFPMFPKESLALDSSTGLALCAAKRIAELHGGKLIATTKSDNLVLEWSCPKSTERTPSTSIG